VQTASLLDPRVLARLATLQLRARRVVEGVLTGLHKSPLRGQAVEFAEHKEYAPGDEIRHIDWRAYARVDKYQVKKYELETNLRAYLILDASASMAYGQGRPSKLEYGKMLAASLAYLLTRQQDQAGLVIAGAPAAASAASELTPPQVDPDERDAKLPSAIRRYLPPRASQSHLNGLLNILEATGPGGETDLAGAIDFVAEKAQRRAAVFVMSDLFDPSPKALASLARLRRRRCEVAVFHLLDPDELEFPFEDPTEFLALEGDARIEANPATIRAGYLDEMQRFLSATRRQLRDADVEYALARTDDPLDRVLLTFLAARRAAARGK
jgi:uncharacterized protein (DUF58 family)